MNEYQSYTSENRKSKQTINTIEELSKNQSFRILKLQTSGLGKMNNSSKRNPQNFDVSQVSTSMPLSQKNMLSFLAHDESKRPNSYEQLFQDLQQSKQQVNNLKDENTRLKTKVQHNEREFLKYENLIEDLTTQKKSNNQDLQIISLRKQVKDKSQELEDKMKELEILKRNSKVCKLQELEVIIPNKSQIEKKVYFEQTLMMKHMLQMAQDQIQYQQSKLEQVQQLESQLDICHEQMFKLQQQNNEQFEIISKKEQIIKELKIQLKNSSIKQQQINQKQQQIQLKYDNLHLLYQSIKGVHNNTQPKDSPLKFPKDIVILKLHQKRVTMNQYNKAIEVLKQAKNKQEFGQMLQIDPFYLSETESQQVVDKLTGTQSLSQQFITQLSYQSLEGLDEQQAQQLINKSLQSKKDRVRQYWIQYKYKKVGRDDIIKFIQAMNFNWDQQTTSYFLLEIFQNNLSNNNVTNNSEQNSQSMRVSIDFITNPFSRQSHHKSSNEVQQQDSFIRDLNEQQSNQQVIENFNPNDEVLINQFFPADEEDKQFEIISSNPQEKLTSKYQQENQIQEVNEEDMLSSKPQDEDNANDIAYLESNQQEELVQEVKSLEILNDYQQ
ncbi:unnamed protein product (macronuclear) [Paramecium tetraurelia]|uniref:LisH domain-containing protein n=1 Tax=Paramecium tetraurelia TaxID=5888 RepID=A0C9F3_PARTE|nr:uncharacterized protein GSPATT00006726001 [Paramecium tetraurelia]CAK67420.1 unnamed protein product [Paramecium tetraurelia]|eukprot:XP_001434817.1 hypothetical protein (macronuclear) [Paramecium tetraurelia strain d4-2]